ncbi:MAG: hypothetical protein M1524_00045 [Patescibacteria group bacterium]|nr:hypothetical protein [Patescibacteria group bacterium]
MISLLFFLNFLFLFLVIVTLLFNWIYARQTEKAKQEFGITLPLFVERLIGANVVIPVFAGILITFLIIIQVI